MSSCKSELHTHTWSIIKYSWSDDKTTCTAFAVCKDDDSHVVTETVKTTSVVEKTAECEEDGLAEHTAISNDEHLKNQTIEVTLDVTGPEILDMRTNTYYRIEGNIVKQLGSGPVYEISCNQIKLAFGGYLYEITEKVFGGFYASVSGGYITTFDLKEKYEISNSLTLKQQLAVVALLFGTH